MDLLFATDPLLRFAAISGISTFAVSALMVLQLMILRWFLDWRESRYHRFIRRWQPVLIAWACGDEMVCPGLAPKNHVNLLHAWNQVHDTVKGDAQAYMVRLAVKLDLENIALSALKSSSLRARVLAALTLGSLSTVRAWDELLVLVDDKDPILSIMGARGLMRIDANRGMSKLVGYFAQRDDWPRSRVLELLRQAGPNAVSAPLARMLRNSEGEATLRCLSWASAADRNVIRPAMLHLLETRDDPQVIAGVLRHHVDPRDLGHMRRLATHPVWYVRVQAIRGIGLAGESNDAKVLARFLDDSHWWVRYRAAMAIVALLRGRLSEVGPIIERLGISQQGRLMLEMAQSSKAVLG